MADSSQRKSNRLPKLTTFFDERIDKNASTKAVNAPSNSLTTKPPAKPPIPLRGNFGNCGTSLLEAI